MRRQWLGVLGWLCVSVVAHATGAPPADTLVYTGFIEENDVPVSQAVTLTVDLLDGQDVLMCSTTPVSVTPIAGYFQVPLPDNCRVVVELNPTLKVHLTVHDDLNNTDVFLPPQPLSAAPYAVTANSAVNVNGGDVNAGTGSFNNGIGIGAGTFDFSGGAGLRLTTLDQAAPTYLSLEYATDSMRLSTNAGGVGSVIQTYGTSVSAPLQLQPLGGRVGIGEVNPGAPLHVVDLAINGTVARFDSPGSFAAIDLKAGTGPSSIADLALFSSGGMALTLIPGAPMQPSDTLFAVSKDGTAELLLQAGGKLVVGDVSNPLTGDGLEVNGSIKFITGGAHAWHFVEATADATVACRTACQSAQAICLGAVRVSGVVQECDGTDATDAMTCLCVKPTP